MARLLTPVRLNQEAILVRWMSNLSAMRHGFIRLGDEVDVQKRKSGANTNLSTFLHSDPHPPLNA